MHSIEFNRPIVGKKIALILNRVLEKKEALEGVPACLFDIVFHNGTKIGQIDLRLGQSDSLIRYGGQVGYGIDRPYRGHHYAADACLLLIPIAKELGFEELWITCNPDNIASVKTCERIGAEFVEEVSVPVGSELWQRGDLKKLRYIWRLPKDSEVV